jgi:hypothetical protein
MFRYVQLMLNITSYYKLSSGAAKIHFFCTVGLMSKTRPLAAVNAAIAQANAQVGSHISRRARLHCAHAVPRAYARRGTEKLANHRTHIVFIITLKLLRFSIGIICCCLYCELFCG